MPEVDGEFLDVVPGTDLASLNARIVELAEAEDAGVQGAVVIDQATPALAVQAAMRPLAASLAALAASVGLVAALSLAYLVGRAARNSDSEERALRALGATRAQLRLLGLLQGATVGALGAVGAAAVAIALSSRFPVGVARVAEPDLGTAADWTTIGAGMAAILILATAAGGLATIGRHPGAVDQRMASRLGGTAPVSRLGPPAMLGVRAVATGSGAWGALGVSVGAVAGIVATLTFGASLSGLLTTPMHYGQGWDRAISANFGAAPAGAAVNRFRDDPGVKGIAVGRYGDVTISGRSVPAFGYRTVTGEAGITVVEGQLASAPDEIALGGETLEGLGLRLGDVAQIDAGDGSRSVKVVGRVVFPRLARGSASATGLGVGAQVPVETLPPPSWTPARTRSEKNWSSTGSSTRCSCSRRGVAPMRSRWRSAASSRTAILVSSSRRTVDRSASWTSLGFARCHRSPRPSWRRWGSSPSRRCS